MINNANRYYYMVQSGKNKWRKHQNRGLKSCCVFFVFLTYHITSFKSKLSILLMVLYGIKWKNFFTLLSVLVKMGKIGRLEGNTLIRNVKTVNLQATNKLQALQCYVHVTNQLNISFHFVTFLLVFCTSPHFTTRCKCSQFCVKVMSWKTIGI